LAKTLKHQLAGYIISGVLATGTDFISYNIITLFTHHLSIVKAFTFLLGTVVAYFYNKIITFEHKGGSVHHVFKFFFLYCISMVLNVAVNQGMLFITNYYNDPSFIKKTTAVIFATFVSMVINFLGQKFWVFRKPVATHVYNS